MITSQTDGFHVLEKYIPGKKLEDIDFIWVRERINNFKFSKISRNREVEKEGI